MTNYHEEIHEWRQTLKTNLRKENSWLALAGLFWLNEGVNSFGAGDENDIIFPDAGIPRQIGAFIVDGENVKLEVSADTLSAPMFRGHRPGSNWGRFRSS